MGTRGRPKKSRKQVTAHHLLSVAYALLVTSGLSIAEAGGFGAMRLFVIDRHAVVRAAFRAVCEADPHLQFAGDSDGTGDITALLTAANVELMLVDYDLPGTSGDELIQSLKSAIPQARILGMANRPEVARNLMLAAGAEDFLDKKDVRQLINALRQIAAAGRAADGIG